MSTDINIKKKLAILEESVSITTDAKSIDFIGSGVNAVNADGNVSVIIPGNSGNTTYYLNESVTQTPYKEFSSVPTTAIEQVVPLTVPGGTTSIIAEYLTPSGVPGTTQIPAGLWQFFLHFNATTAGQDWIIRPTVYKRDLGGTETLLFTPDPEIVVGMPTTTTMYVSDGVFPATTLLTTDRILVRISMQNTTGVSQTVNFRTEGSQHYSVSLTTLNQVVPTGAVASVTGTAPIVSSGGTNPAISIPQATGSVNGYLSSSDWSVFSAKLGGSGTTNYLSKFTGTGTLGNSIIQDNGSTASINGSLLSAYKFIVYSNTLGENYCLAGNTTVNGSVGVVGISNGTGASTNYGVSGSAQNSTTKNIAVYGQAQGASAENIGGQFRAITGTNNYAVQLQDGTESLNKFLKSVSADGKANWANITVADTGLTLTTTGTSGAATLVGSTLNVPQYAGGLTYFTEAQSTSAPNATVNVDSLTAIASTTNADFAIIPKGNGAILAQVPDSGITGGDKRGAYATDLQRSRAGATQVASGGSSTVGGGSENMASGGQSTSIGGYRNYATNTGSTALGGYQNQATGLYSVTIGGQLNQATNNYATSGGYNSIANGNSSVALGFVNTANGSGSVALGGNNTAGNNYAMAFGSNSTASNVYSSVLGGQGGQATKTHSTVIGGYYNSATGDYSVACGFATTASGGVSFAGGQSSTASNNHDFAFGNACNIASGGYYANVSMGYQNTVNNGLASTVFGSGNIVNWFHQFAAGNNHRLTSGDGSVALGKSTMDDGYGRSMYGRAGWVRGDTQSSKIILNRRTTDATASVLVIDSPAGNTPSVSNQITLQNNNVFRIKGSITGKQSGSTNVGVWDIDCVIVRGVGVATTTIAGTPSISLVVNTGSFGAPTLTANTTLGCLTVTVTGVLATNIQWTCVIDTCEVIYA